jgi:hypothetical protein
MNRTLKKLGLKWYHIKTLEKYFNQSAVLTELTDANGTKFGACQFEYRGWQTLQFIQHPKTGRYAKPYNSTLNEIGFVTQNL